MNSEITLQELLDNTDPSHIWLSSDWHLFKNRRKKEKNEVNTREIISYCKKTFKPNDVFLYLGDLTYRFATEGDNEEATKLMKSIPGIKVLILGNHDTFLGEQFYSDCGFSYVMERLEWDTYIFTHRPIRMDLYPEDYWNIHGHVHMITKYNNSDGSKNINVYPGRFNNKPVTLKYLLAHKEKLVKDNYYNDNNGLLGESTIICKEDEDQSYNTKLEVCKSFSGNDPLETIMNMEMVTEFTINDLMRGGNVKDGVSHILELKRSEIPEEEFGVPQLRKYPLDTEAHVRSAIKFFNYVDKKYEKQLALKIKRKMKEYGIDDIHISEKNRLSKYITEFCIEACDYAIRSLSTKHEYSMASMNPLQGITKPCVMVASNSNTIPNRLYAFSPSLISPKYLVIDENCKLQLVDRSYLDNMRVDIYDFSGDAKNVRKIYKAYKEQEVVPSSYIYECLSGRKMLSEDQLQYDPCFRKLDLNNLDQIDGFQNNIEEFKEFVLEAYHDDIL